MPEEEGKEETEESLPKEAMDLEKTHDDAHDGKGCNIIFGQGIPSIHCYQITMPSNYDG